MSRDGLRAVLTQAIDGLVEYYFDRLPLSTLVTWGTAVKYSDDQPRDESGRWTSGGGGDGGESGKMQTIRQNAERAAHDFGIPPDKIEIVDGLSSENANRAGDYNSYTGKIRIYSDAINYPESVKGIIAHEFMHGVYTEFSSRATREKWQYSKDESRNLDNYPDYKLWTNISSDIDNGNIERASSFSDYAASFWAGERSGFAIQETFSDAMYYMNIGRSEEVPEIIKNYTTELLLAHIKRGK